MFNFYNNKIGHTYFEIVLVTTFAFVLFDILYKFQNLQISLLKYIKLRNYAICTLDSIENKLLLKYLSDNFIDSNFIDEIIKEFATKELFDIKIEILNKTTDKKIRIKVILTNKSINKTDYKENNLFSHKTFIREIIL